MKRIILIMLLNFYAPSDQGKRYEDKKPSGMETRVGGYVVAPSIVAKDVDFGAPEPALRTLLKNKYTEQIVEFLNSKRAKQDKDLIGLIERYEAFYDFIRSYLLAYITSKIRSSSEDSINFYTYTPIYAATAASPEDSMLVCPLFDSIINYNQNPDLKKINQTELINGIAEAPDRVKALMKEDGSALEKNIPYQIKLHYMLEDIVQLIFQKIWELKPDLFPKTFIEKAIRGSRPGMDSRTGVGQRGGRITSAAQAMIPGPGRAAIPGAAQAMIPGAAQAMIPGPGRAAIPSAAQAMIPGAAQPATPLAPGCDSCGSSTSSWRSSSYDSQPSSAN